MTCSRPCFNRRRHTLGGLVAGFVAIVGSASEAQTPALVEAMKDAKRAKVAIAAAPPYAYLAPSGEAQAIASPAGSSK